MNYLTGLDIPALLSLVNKGYERYSKIRAREPRYKRSVAIQFKENKVERGLSSLGTFKLKKLSTVVHAPCGVLVICVFTQITNKLFSK